MLDNGGAQATATLEDAAAPASSDPSNVVHVNGHTVTLHPKVTMPIGMAALSVVKQGGSQAVIEAGLAEVYLRFGIVSWDFADPLTPENIERLLPYNEGGLEVAEAADALYSGDVFRPLVARLSRLSPTSQTARSTSATRPTGSKHPKPSKRSSRKNSEDGPPFVGPV